MIELGLCLIAKDEKEAYLREWLDYHFLAGADFVCIYDNGSAVPLKSILSDIPNLEIVNWPGAYVQYHAYSNFLERYRGQIKWGGFIDADEFIVSQCGNIKQNLSGHSPFGGLGLSWRMFGSNGLTDNESSQINAFTKRAPDDFPPNRHIKTIAQLAVTTRYTSPHSFAYAGRYFCANELGHPCYGPYANFTAQYIHINHYYTRSYNEYQHKLSKGRADGPIGRAPFKDYDKNEVEDLTLVNIYKNLKAQAASK